MTTPTFRKYFVRVIWGLSLGTRLPNLKFVPSAVLELLAFKVPKFTGSRDRDHAHFSEIFVRGHVGTILGNTPAKFEVRTFSRFGTDGQTDRPEEAYLASGRG